MSFEILSKIEHCDDVKSLSDQELYRLCAEIREKLIDVISVNGGHLSPNLGAVELTVALHREFSCPTDSVVFDVGHQSYTHKMLTGRYKSIETIRREGGLSGFPKREESDCDAFDTGHASTSISAALGIAKAKELSGDNSYTIAVIGDGSMTGGLAFEGLNNAGRAAKNFIVILNDNKMSISKNVGAMARYLNSMRTKPSYLRMKNRVERGLDRVPMVGEPTANLLRRQKTRFKHILYRNTVFDKLGFSYYGPVNGNDLHALQNVLKAAKEVRGPVLIHVITKKGKGYSFAEHDSASFHGIGSFNIDTGEPMSANETFSSVFGDELCALAQQDPRVCAVTAAMRTGTGLVAFSKSFKDRFFDVGIAESHAVTFSAGLSTKGFLPVFAVYSTFLQRSYDQILHDGAMQHNHVVLAIDRAGVVGEDGETHQGLFDVAMLNPMPHTAIFSPTYFDGLRKSLRAAIFETEGIVAVRYPRGSEPEKIDGYDEESIDYDFFDEKNADALLVCYGRLFSEAMKAKAALKEQGVTLSVLKLCRIKPISEDALKKALRFKTIFFFEEGMRSGSVAERFEKQLRDMNFDGDVSTVAVEERFVSHATVKSSLHQLGLDAESMIETIQTTLKPKRD